MLSDNRFMGKKIKDVIPNCAYGTSEFVICGIDLDDNRYICASPYRKFEYKFNIICYGDNISECEARYIAMSEYKGFQVSVIDTWREVECCDFLDKLRIEW